MYNEWSLDILYKGLDDEKYKEDFRKLYNENRKL